MYSFKVIAKCLVAAAIFGLAPAAVLAENPTGTPSTATTPARGNMQGSMMRSEGGGDQEMMKLREENHRLKEENTRLKREIEQMRKGGTSSTGGTGTGKDNMQSRPMRPMQKPAVEPVTSTTPAAQ